MKTSIKLLLIATLFGFMAAPTMRASDFDKKTFVTFHQSMEIPGMVLPAGDYVMKRADRSLPDVIQFANSNENHVYATVFALPTYRQEPTDEVVILTEERPANAPEAIKKWFYPGDIVGAEFVYPKSGSRLTVMASASTPIASSAPISTPAEAAVQTPPPAPSPSEQTAETVYSSPQPLEIAQSTMPQTTAQSTSSSRAQTAQTSPEPQPELTAQEELPRTASILPLLGLLGMFGAIGGWTVLKLANRLS